MSDYTTEKLDKKQYLSDKKQFLLDMLIISEEKNFEIGRRLKDQAEYLESLCKIAWEVGHIKQDARADVFKLAEKMEIPMNTNKRPREVDMLYFGDGSKRGIENETKETTSSVTPNEPRKGHWIEHPHEAGPNWEYSMYECSECHDWAEDDSDYCPDCGAKMEEAEE